MEDFETSVNTEEVADLSEADVTSEVTEPTNEDNSTVETVEEPAKPQQTAEENTRFAEVRRKYETETQAIKAQNDRLLSALSAFGYEGSPEEIADTLMSQTQGITVEQARAERETREQETEHIQLLQSETEFFKNIAIEKLMADDLSKIKNTYKDDAKVQGLKSLNELGDDFFKTLNATNDPVLAYDIIQAKQVRETKPTPPEIGGVNGSSSKEKDFYTSEEVDRLTEKDMDNPRIRDIVRKSMLKWR